MGVRSSRPPEEEATVLLGAHFPEAFARRFKVRAAERGMTIKALLEEAITDTLAKPPEDMPQAKPAGMRQPD